MREMKDSGVPWIGNMPADWELVSVKRLFTIGRGRVIAQTELDETGYPVYSSQTKDNGCLGYIDTYDYDYPQLTWTTDGANAGSIFLRDGYYNCTNVCGTLNPIGDLVDLRYQKYALEHIAYNERRIDTNGYKIMNNEMAIIKTLLPPLSVQHHIADYLDIKCTQIDNIILTEQAVIEKLQEYKQSIITETITKGLDSTTNMEYSGFKWLGNIPINCNIHSLKKVLLTPITDGPHETPTLYDEGIPFVSAESVKGGIINLDYKRGYISLKDHERFQKKVSPRKGDIFIVKSGATTGNIGIVTTDQVFDIWSPLALVRGDSSTVEQDFLYYQLLSNIFRVQVEQGWSYGTQQNIGMKVLGNIKVLIPPLESQKNIVKYLDNKCSNMDTVIQKKHSLIDKLIEYKKSLIYEVVTGKKEVPHV
ncbi:restriction endonuclease subunit S [Veillonella parvula]|jgi:putative type I restriction enzyme specificity protein|uniref:restriction endonuclease subunit S n=1 Tax=Veillonella parvula TaxID=29466 RepID=UPI000989D18C|nr:restriction endonuclease subunit S [Veillonella parvula]